MNNLSEAAQHLAKHWLARKHTQALPQDCRPATPAEGYAMQALWPTLAGIEVPDSRFIDFERAGEAPLIADCACCNDMVLGQPLPPSERLNDLANLAVRAQMSDGRVLEGIGSHVLGDPVQALIWFFDEMSSAGQRIEAGQFLTTGACVTPIPVQPGQTLQADFGWLGAMRVSFV